jgi:hypothetical protein
MKRGVVFVGPDASEARLRVTAPGAGWYAFEVGKDQTKAGFFDSVQRCLPLDPPLGGFRLVWDALQDSVWGGLDALHSGGDVVVYWRDAHRMRTADPSTYETALSVFEQVADSIADPEYNPSPIRLLVLIGDASASS